MSYDLLTPRDVDKSSENAIKWTYFVTHLMCTFKGIKSITLPHLSLSAGNYRTQLYDKQREEYLPATQGLGMFVEVKDPDDKVNKQIKQADMSIMGS